jgi:hypothetical protein
MGGYDAASARQVIEMGYVTQPEYPEKQKGRGCGPRPGRLNEEMKRPRMVLCTVAFNSRLRSFKGEQAHYEKERRKHRHR